MLGWCGDVVEPPVCYVSCGFVSLCCHTLFMFQCVCMCALVVFMLRVCQVWRVTCSGSFCLVCVISVFVLVWGGEVQRSACD